MNSAFFTWYGGGVQLFALPLSVEFSRQEYWNGLPFPPPGDFPDLRIKFASATSQADSLPLSQQGSPLGTISKCLFSSTSVNANCAFHCLILIIKSWLPPSGRKEKDAVDMTSGGKNKNQCPPAGSPSWHRGGSGLPGGGQGWSRAPRRCPCPWV